MPSDDHATLPLVLPSLTHLTNEELGAFRDKVGAASRDARRKANQVLQKHGELKAAWSRSLSITGETPEADRANILGTFERELLRVPEAFIAHAFANSLVTLVAVCRNEALHRAGQHSKK